MNKKFLIILTLFFALAVYQYRVYFPQNFSFSEVANAQDVSINTGIGQFTDEELVSMVKPSMVRVIKHVEGNVSIPPFKIDVKNFKVQAITGEKSLTMPVDINITGSGFVVSPDGYILTNAHTVSDMAVKMQIVQPMIKLMLTSELSSLNPNEIKKMDSVRTKEDGIAFGREILDYVISKSTFNLVTKTVILNPTSSEETLDKRIEHGFSAVVVHANERWLEDDKDVAILKIEEKNLPSLRLGTGEKLTVGTSAYVFNIPTNPESNGDTLLESRFVKGIITAFKNSQYIDFNIIETDAKVSQSSSGGPLFDSDGQVVGVATVEPGSDDQSKDDGLTAAVPSEVAKMILSQNLIINDEGAYTPHLKKGLLLAHNSHCKSALEEFMLAKGINQKFDVAKYVNPFIEKCNALISSGRSIDSKWSEFTIKVGSLGILAWALFAAGIFLLVVLGISAAILTKKFKKEQVELKHIIEHQHEVDTSVSPQSPFTTVVKREKSISDSHQQLQTTTHDLKGDMPQVVSHDTDSAHGAHEASSTKAPIPPHPALLSYIKEARQAGLTFQEIQKALKNAGWSDDEVARAVAIPQS